MKKIILLTGATGFLGKEVYKILSSRDYEIKAISSVSYRLKNHIPCDLSNPKELIRLLHKVNPSIVINLAAKISFNASTVSSLYALNVLCPAIIADYCLNNDSLLLQASTIAVNGNNEKKYGVDTSLHPDTNYGKSKLYADELIQASGCNFTILRYGGIFGLNGPDHLGINSAINNSVEGTVPSLIGTGDAIRNYIYVKDAAQALVKCFEEEITGIHYLGGEEKTIKSMLNDICDVFILGRKPEHIEGEEAVDQIIEKSDYFNITPFRIALEQLV